MYDVMVASGRFLGGGMKMCPEADPSDGLFDVLLIGDISKRDLVLTLPKIYRGTHLPHPKAELLRGKRVTIESAIPLPVQLDGEQPGTTPATFEVVPNAPSAPAGALARAGRRPPLRALGRCRGLRSRGRTRRGGAPSRRPLASGALALGLFEPRLE